MNIFSDWAHIPSHIDPVIFTLGSLQIRWYGLMYLAGFATLYSLLFIRIKTEKTTLHRDILDDYMFWAILGVIAGGRIGYVLFYDLSYFLSHPLQIIVPFDLSSNPPRFIGIFGMSYHGGLIGVIISSLIFCRKKHLSFLHFADFIIPAVPAAYFFGRIGNFINGELYGRATSAPWGMFFPLDPTGQLRHPSQLYEALGEGILLFLLLWGLRKRQSFPGFLLSLYLMGYGLVRLLIEFVREPDGHIGLFFYHVTLGQVLCAGMILAGVVLFIFQKNFLRTKEEKQYR